MTTVSNQAYNSFPLLLESVEYVTLIEHYNNGNNTLVYKITYVDNCNFAINN